jgi:peptidyl-prolyl cis-trans isomerase C
MFPALKTVTVTVALVLCFCFAAVRAPAQEGAAGTTPDAETVAVVNGTVITKEQVDRELTGHQQKMVRAGQALNPELLAGLRERVIEGLIDRTLLHQASVKGGITVSDEEVDEQFGQIREQFPSDEAFNSVLMQMNMTEEVLREELRGGISVNKFVDERFGSSADISPGEARAYYDSHPEAFVTPEQVRARHILIRSDAEGGEDAEGKARKAIEEIREEALAGGDFGELAKEHSQCPSSEQGGDLGYFTRGKMTKDFEDTAFALEPGELSGIVDTEFGHHLIKVEDRKPEGTIPFEDVEERLRAYLGQEAVKEAVQSYVKQLRLEGVIQREGGEE